MKSKSPFKAKVDIFQGSTSTYRHPSTVIQPIVGAQVGAQIAKTAAEVTAKAITAKSEKPKKQFDFKVGPKPEALTVPDFEYDFGMRGGKETREVPGQSSKMLNSEMTPQQRDWKSNYIKTYGQAKYNELVQERNKTSNIKQFRTYSLDEKGKKTNFSDWTNSPNTMKGSPVKHDAEASPKGFFAKTAGSLAAAAGNAIKSQGPDRGGVSAEDFASGNYAKPNDATTFAQQRAANAGGSTGVDPFLPPPNQVAETGSYSGGRDRILEMDSNPVVNQSIGRDTEIASQLFGSGQRASMLAMKGSPMHNGKKYKKGDLIDESDFEALGTGYNVQNISDIQEDEKGQFMTTLGDSEIYSDRPRPISRIIDYPDPKGSPRDTIRPKVGKFFKRS